MRKGVLIIASFVVLLVVALVGMALYHYRKVELERNALKIKPAQNKRWPENKPPAGDGGDNIKAVPQEEIIKTDEVDGLDQINTGAVV